ncbi:MAG TPA: tetratricopeptide repeat protein [Anaerohalosphaeraceae bacterium]|nr:tetratricopeptide repeat protein [Anaerohalosphaeraceae bacterium]
MSKLLEIFGKAITVDTAELIWHWLMTLRTQHQPAPPPWQNELDDVLEHLGRHEFRPAAEKMKGYLFEYPNCIFGHMTAVALCLYRNDIQAAYEQLQSVYLRQPNNTMALYAMGYCQERMGHLTEAVEFYQDCIKFKSHLQLPRLRMAAIYLQSGRLDKTIREYEMLTTEHPEDISAHVLLGNLYLMNGRAAEAIDTFNMAILSHPDNFREDCPSEEINNLLESGCYEQALENILGLMEQTGPQPDLYLHLADIYSQSQKPAEAIAHYENALRLQPNYLEAAIKLGTQYLRNHQYTLAAEQFNQAAEINDEIVDAYMGLCRAQYAAGQTEEAEQTIALGAAIQQNSGLLYSETAILYFQAALDAHRILHGEIEKTAIQMEDVLLAHQKQIAKRVSCADVYYKYGILLMSGGHYEEAVGFFRKAIEINDTHYRANTKMAMCCFEMGRTQEALQLITTQTPVDQNLMQLHYRTAILFCDQKQFTRAMRHLKAVMQQEDSLGLYQNIELVLENLGLIDRTLSTWKQLSEMMENILPQAVTSQ